MAEFIEKTDTLNEGREKINAAIQDAEDAKTTAVQAVNVSEQAKQIAQTAENKADNVQEQFNQVVIEGDSSVEAAQARVDADGNTFTTLKERLDTKETQFASKLTQIALNVFDFGTNIEEGLKSALEYSEPATILVPSGDYLVNEPISATLYSNKIISVSGKVTLTFMGDNNGQVININQNGNSLEIYGDLNIDCNQKARQGLVARNNTGSMENPPNFIATNIKVRNGLSATVGQPCDGILIQGAYELIELNNPIVEDMDRLEGVGVPGFQGTKGINITHNGVNNYPRLIVINNPIIKRITSQEPDESPNNLDCDGISVFAPATSDNEGVPLESHLIINGGVFEDCRGRSIKSQTTTNSITSPTFIRKDIKTIVNGCEVDLQRGLGTIKDIKLRYSQGAEGNPLGNSFRVINAEPNGEGFVTVDGVEAYIGLPDTSPLYFMTFPNTSGGDEFSFIGIKNITMFGTGAFSSIVRGNFSKVKKYSIDNVVARRFTSCLIDNTATGSSTSMGTVNNTHNLDWRLVPLELTSGNGTIKTGTGNSGFITDFRSGITPDTETLRTNKLMGKDTRSGAIALETKQVPAGSTVTFSPRGEAANIGFYFLVINQVSNYATDLFSVAGNSIQSLKHPGGSAVIEYGNGSNPNVEGKFNVWFTSEGCHINNRTSTGRNVSLISIG